MSFIARHLSQRGLLATDYAIQANDFSASSYDRGQDEEAGRRHKGEHTREEEPDCKVCRAPKSLRKRREENGIFQIGFGR